MSGILDHWIPVHRNSGVEAESKKDGEPRNQVPKEGIDGEEG